MDAVFAKDDRKRSRTAKSCGPDAPMAGVKFARSLRFLGTTVTNKLWSRRGEHGISRKPLRGEGRSVSAEPVCSCAFCYLPLHMRPRVQRAPGLPCALSFLRADEFAKLGRMASRERPCSSSSAEADDPVFRGVSDGIVNSRRTGYSAFAEYDGGGRDDANV
jgi:hypothetical protein